MWRALTVLTGKHGFFQDKNLRRVIAYEGLRRAGLDNTELHWCPTCQRTISILNGQNLLISKELRLRKFSNLASCLHFTKAKYVLRSYDRPSPGTGISETQEKKETEGVLGALATCGGRWHQEHIQGWDVVKVTRGSVMQGLDCACSGSLTHLVPGEKNTHLLLPLTVWTSPPRGF